MSESVVIVGAGQAAGQLVASLAQERIVGSVTLVGDEPYPPYQRPPLSKKFLAGELELDRLYLKPAAFYEQAGTALRLGARVTRIDRARRSVLLADGTSLAYTILVLATGSRPRELPLPGAFYLRTIADVEAIRARLAPGKSLLIIGGGYIGLELAAVAATQGLRVSVLEQAPRLMARGVGPVVSAFYARLHGEHGVDIRLGASVADRPAADIVVVGIGAIPNVELAQDAGLPVEDGILVDAQCRTDDPAILAIGDCARQHNPVLGRSLRLESVHHAIEQGRIAAATICGRPALPPQVPWFWSDQYDVKLQIAGLSAGHDQAIVRGDPARGHSFAVFYLRGGRLIATDAVNRAPEFMLSRQLIAEGASPDVAKLADESISVKDLRG
jgi:3-phenylpropionate/trans-cinnamate dioxygenase ferredoxin reductase subunit